MPIPIIISSIGSEIIKDTAKSALRTILRNHCSKDIEQTVMNLNFIKDNQQYADDTDLIAIKTVKEVIEEVNERISNKIVNKH